MGILSEPAQFIRDLALPKGFSVCELGDQWVTYTDPHQLASEFYKELGCGRYESIDGNGRGTITADLNRPLSPDLGLFDLVTDFGTGEHIFNQHQVWKSVHYLTKPNGGFIVFDRPVQGYDGHCYYLTHEALYNDLALANGYEVVRLEHATMKRGELIRGVFRRKGKGKFVIPQQGRYKKILQI